ncbi:MAG: pyridoxal phosphate-dependent aminotransferase, partial [Candidatus Marinimicrobia bacterium]|nr:pyridoxal phosphate-dependent aminotransferase [Candidatus Neomarinimicrobiota bacterium]
MNIFADRVSRVKGSATLAMATLAGELRAAGVDVINLSVGEPDFPTPSHIIAAAKQAMDDGFTRYTPGPGLPVVRQAAATKLERDSGIKVAPSQIIVSNGGKHSLFNACMALFQAGDEVIMFSPYWVSFPEFVNFSHATPVIVGTNAQSNFEPLFDDLADRITPRTKGIIVNSPSNPTGGVWSRAAMKQVIGIAREHDLWLFSDECYEALTYDEPFESAAYIDPDYEKILTFQSCSKTYAMTGWRCGYMAGPEDVVKAMSKLQGQSTSCPNSIAQMAAVAALTGEQDVVQEMKAAFDRRRKLFVDLLRKIDGIDCAMPGGAFYVFPDVSAFFGKSVDGTEIKTPDDVTQYLLNEAHVVTVSGEAFGDDRHVRLS